MVHQSMQYNCFDYKQVHELVFSITCLHSAYTDIQFFLKVLASNQTYMALHWITAHCRAPGNEKADTLHNLDKYLNHRSTYIFTYVLQTTCQERPPTSRDLNIVPDCGFVNNTVFQLADNNFLSMQASSMCCQWILLFGKRV